MPIERNDQRAVDQDSAMKNALIDDTLPIADRRVTALSDLPVGATATWKKTEDGETWEVAPTPNVKGHGKTLARAIAMIGATAEKNPETGAVTFRDVYGDELPPEVPDVPAALPPL